MIENELIELNKHVKELIESVSRLTEFVAEIAPQKAKTTPPEVKKPTSKKTASKKPENARSEPETQAPESKITRYELQQFTLSVVRENRNLREPIKKLVTATGAKFMSDVPEDKIDELKIAIEALVK